MNISAFAFLFTFFLSSLLSSCYKGNDNNVKEMPVAMADLRNVSYGSDTIQKMDIYLPANRDTVNTKILLFIHGGGWSAGDKSEFNEAIAAIRPKLPDFAIFNMNYRLANNNVNKFPSAIDDIKNAISFIEKNAAEYKVNINKVGIIGASAGGHLALLHAYKNNNNGKIKAVVDLFAPVDLVDMYNNHPIPEQARQMVRNFLGKTPATDPEVYREASPLNFITNASAPTIIFHGIQDIVVPISQSNTLKNKLLANGVKVQMTAYDGEGHGWFGNNLQDTYTKAVEFLKDNIK